MKSPLRFCSFEYGRFENTCSNAGRGCSCGVREREDDEGASCGSDGARAATVGPVGRLWAMVRRMPAPMKPS